MSEIEDDARAPFVVVLNIFVFLLVLQGPAKPETMGIIGIDVGQKRLFRGTKKIISWDKKDVSWDKKDYFVGQKRWLGQFRGTKKIIGTKKMVSWDKKDGFVGQKRWSRRGFYGMMKRLIFFVPHERWF